MIFFFQTFFIRYYLNPFLKTYCLINITSGIFSWIIFESHQSVFKRVDSVKSISDNWNNFFISISIS